MGSTLPLTLFQSWETEQAPEGPISRASGREPKPEALAGADFTGPGGVFPARASGMLLPVRAKLGSVPTKAGCDNSVKRESPDAKEIKNNIEGTANGLSVARIIAVCMALETLPLFGHELP